MKTLLFVHLLICISLKFSQSFQKCYTHNFDQCLSQGIFDGLKNSNTSLKQYGFPNLEPLEVKNFAFEIPVPRGQVIYTHFQVHGLTNIQAPPRVNMDFHNSNLTIELIFPELLYTCNLDLVGAFKGAHADGTGKKKIYLENVYYGLTFLLGENEPSKEGHYLVKDAQVKFVPTDVVKFEISDFYGQPSSEVVTKILNDNLQMIARLMIKEYELTFASVFHELLEDFLSALSAVQ